MSTPPPPPPPSAPPPSAPAARRASSPRSSPWSPCPSPSPPPAWSSPSRPTRPTPRPPSARPATGPPAPSPSPTTTATPPRSPRPTPSPGPPAPAASWSPATARCPPRCKRLRDRRHRPTTLASLHRPHDHPGHRRLVRVLHRLRPAASGAERLPRHPRGFGLAHTSYTNGVGGWNPTGAAPESRTYQLSYIISPDAPNDTMGGTAAGDIVFEAQNS